MKIGYTIVSINDDRIDKKRRIRETVGYHEVREIPFVNGRDSGTVEAYFDSHPDVRLERVNRTRGELGIWFSLINCWEWLVESDLDALIVFEDDAMVHPLFNDLTDEFVKHLPEDFDALCLFVPDNQLQDYHYRVRFDDMGVPIQTNTVRDNVYHIPGNDVIARSYQGYSCVCLMWSKAGAQRMLDIVKKKGMYSPVDCQIFLEANLRNLNVYAPLPDEELPVWYDWNNSPTQVHDTYPYEGWRL